MKKKLVPLAQSYPDRPTFAAAVVAYEGSESVSIDGELARKGTLPSLSYVTTKNGDITSSSPSAAALKEMDS